MAAEDPRYHASARDDLHAMLVAHGDWMPLGSADEQKAAADGTVESWARAQDNPVGGWYGLKKGLRGRFANSVPPVLEALGRAEVEHNPRNNRMRALLEFVEAWSVRPMWCSRQWLGPHALAMRASGT